MTQDTKLLIERLREAAELGSEVEWQDARDAATLIESLEARIGEAEKRREAQFTGCLYCDYQVPTDEHGVHWHAGKSYSCISKGEGVGG